jgi:hypothetical protein
MYQHMAPSRSLHANAVQMFAAVVPVLSSPRRSKRCLARAYAPASARKDARAADVML